MGTNALKGALLGVDEAELSRLVRAADRLLLGTPDRPHGTSPRRLRSGRGLEFLELRAHQAGDDPRDIDWRATARSRQPLVRRYQDEAFATVLLCLDCSSSMAVSDPAPDARGRASAADEPGSKWQLAVQLTVALAYLLLNAGNRVGVVGFSSGIDLVCPPARGRTAFARLLASLAQARPRPEGAASRLEACDRFVARGVEAVVLSDFLAPDFMRSGLEQLRKRGGRVQALQILSASELALADGSAPEGGRPVLLRDAESGERRSLRLTPEARRAAEQQLSDLGQRLVHFCRESGVPLTRCHSGSSWREVMLAHLRGLGPYHA